MPPKTQKQKEEEAARLTEEQRIKEEEKQRKRIRKIQNQQTKQYQSSFTDHIDYVYPHSEPHKSTLEYLLKVIAEYLYILWAG